MKPNNAVFQRRFRLDLSDERTLKRLYSEEVPSIAAFQYANSFHSSWGHCHDLDVPPKG